MSLAQDHVLIPPIAHHVHLLMLQTVGIPCQLPREMGLFARLGTVQWMVRRVLNTLIARRILQQHPGHCIHFSNPPPSPAGYLRLGGLTDNGTLAFMSSRSAGMFAGSEQKLHTNDRSRIFFKSPSAKSLWEIQSGIAPSVPLRQVPDNKAPPRQASVSLACLAGTKYFCWILKDKTSLSALRFTIFHFSLTFFLKIGDETCTIHAIATSL